MKLFPRDDFSCPNNIFDISELLILHKIVLSTAISLLPIKCQKEKSKYKKSSKSSFLYIIWGADFQPFSQS